MIDLSAEVNYIKHVDVLAHMMLIPNASVNAVISDPPYNLTELDFETVIDWPVFWSEARRILVSPKSPVILFSQQPFTTDLIVSNRKGYRNEIIWEKTMPVGFLNANRRPLQAHENILVFADKEPDYMPQMEICLTEKKGRVIKNSSSKHYQEFVPASYQFNDKRFPRSVWRFAQHKTFDRSDTTHPTQKPLPLMERLILTYTHTGDLILDPFCGSGSTGAAARNCGRRYLLGDSDAKWVQTARERLALPFTPTLF